jgi:hypothetical protein
MTSTAEMMERLRAKRAEYSRNDSKVVKIKEGKTRVRILLQPNEDPVDFGHDVGVHWIKGDENAKPLAVAGSRSVTFDEECMIATLIEKVITNAPDDETVAMAKLWKPTKRVYVNALIRSGDDKSESPVVLELTSSTFDQVMGAYETFYDENEFSMLDPEKGIDLWIERKGKGIDTEYLVNMTSKPVPVSKESLEKRIDLRSFIEKEHFATGKEAQALAAITRLTGVSLSGGALAGPAVKSGLLTGPSSKVIDADVDDLDDVVPIKKPTATKTAKAEKPAPAKVEDDLEDLDIDSALGELDALEDD